MIARLEGRLVEKLPERLVLDVGGVGYEVRVPLSTFLELPDTGKTVALCVHTHVREDAFVLYGFLRDAERVAFVTLLGISGVGPRIGLAILSGLPVDRLIRAVRAEDLASIQAVPGVGRKTAERILIELRDKVDRFEGAAPVEMLDDSESATVSALENLGYPRAQAERAVRAALKSLPDAPPLDDLIREALRVAAG